MEYEAQKLLETTICTLLAATFYLREFKLLIGLFIVQLTRVGASTYDFVIITVKIAILLQYLRIFSRGRDKLYWAYHILIWLHILFYLTSAFLQIFPCNPVEKYWKPWIKEGRCLDTKIIYIATASFNSVSDISVLIMPQNVIWNLQMSLQKKIGISMVFLTGGF